MTNSRLVWSVACAASLALGLATLPAPAHAQATPTTPAGPGRGRMGQMMAERQKMQAQMAAQEKKLDELVAQMNAARGADKIDKVAAALTELVAQHKAMHQRMMGPGGMMMSPGTPGAADAPPAQGRGAGPSLPGAHDQHAQTGVEEMCLPDV